MNLFDLFVTIGVKDETTGPVSQIKATTIAAGQLMADAVKATGTAVVNLGKQALEGFAETEQLRGGVETLFKESANTINQYAENAYKTAGLSANEYMSTVTSFSASLLQSLDGDTAAAAKYADQAITDMADNANKMGTDISMIQNAYQGFAKQNFTMLDNLKLGYGGTKEEMQRLLDYAEELSGQEFDLSSYSDIVEAIHVVQTEMGITGTTAKEASETISGSAAAMKASWVNLVAGIADENADLDVLLGNFVESLGTAARNVIPRISIIAQGIGELVVTHAPQIIEAGKNMLQTFAQGFVDNVPALAERVTSVVSAFNGFVRENVPMVLEQGVDMLNSLVDGILSGIPEMVSRLPAVIDGAVTYFADNASTILSAGAEILSNLISGIIKTIPKLVAELPKVITSFVNTIRNNFPKVITAGFDVLMKLGDGIFEALPELVRNLPEIGTSILEGFSAALSGIVDIGVDIVRGLWEGIQSMAGWIGEKVTGFFNNLFSDVEENEEINSPSKKWARIGAYDAQGFGAGWDKEFSSVRNDITGSLDFGTASVDFSSSGMGVASAGIINSIADSGDNVGGAMTVNLVLPDGTAFARYFLPYFIDVARSDGTPILNPL